MGIAERKKRDARRMRDLITEAAMRLFLEHGYEKVSIRRIAEEIEYSPATLYLYFKDKDEILFTLHNEGFEDLYKRQQTVLSVKDPLERLRRHGELYVSFALEKPEYYDLMFIMRSPAKLIKKKKEWTSGLRSYEFLVRNVRECMDAARIPKMDIDVAAFTFWAHVHGVASLIIRNRCVMYPEEKLGQMVRESISLLVDGISK
jgi:AcrR family transcriptional regulator